MSDVLTKQESDIYSNMSILIVSWDGYKDLWDIYIHQFFKYWPDCPYPVYLGSNFLSCADRRVKSILIGEDHGYSSNLIKMLEKIETQWLFLFAEDLFLSDKVNSSNVEKIVALAKDKDAGHVKLNSKVPYTAALLSTPWTKDDLIEIPYEMQYRVSIGMSIWQHKVLVKLLKDGESAWDIERDGTLRSKMVEEKFYCLSRGRNSIHPFQFINGVIGRRWTREAIKLLKKENLSGYIQSRKTESRIRYSYRMGYSYFYYYFCKILFMIGGVKAMEYIKNMVAIKGSLVNK